MRARHKADEQGAEGQEVVEKDLGRLEDMLQQVSLERDQLRDQLLRTMADFQNYRKRQEDQRRLVVVIPPGHPHVADDELREEREIEADEDEQRVELAP